MPISASSGPTPLTAYDRFRNARFFPGLEGLRAVAALMVVLHHARGDRLWGWLEGWNGVTLFFVLSGFLITTLALREEDRRGALDWRAFFVRRAFRILPLYLVALALYAAVTMLLTAASHRGAFVHAVPWYLSPFPEVPFYTRTHIVFSLAWSLGIEEKFYLVWPLLAFVLLRGRVRGRLGLALGLALVLQLPIAITGGGRALAPYSALLIGCALAFAMHNRATFARLRRLGTAPGFVLAATLLVAMQALTHVVQATAPGQRIAVGWYYLPYSVAAALLVASLVLRARPARVFETAALRFVGRVSYPLYLVHPIALGFVALAIKPGGTAAELGYLAAGLALALGMSYALHRTVETPLIAVGKRLARPTGPRPVERPALAEAPPLAA